MYNKAVSSLVKQMASWDLTDRQVCDVEMLLTGAFKPLQGFLKQTDYDRVLHSMRLADGQLWPMPITLDVSETFADTLNIGQTIALRDSEGVLLAFMLIEDCWIADKKAEAQAVFGTTDPSHPGVDYLLHRTGKVYLGGKLEKVELPLHYDYRQYRHTPAELKARFEQLGWQQVLGYHTREVMHRAEQALTAQAAESLQTPLLIQPVVGLGGVGRSIDHFTRVRCYEQILPTYALSSVMLSLLPLAVRLAGPREALWYALIRKNYACTHFIVQESLGSPVTEEGAESFYHPAAAPLLVNEYAEEIGISIVTPAAMQYVPALQAYRPMTEIGESEAALALSVGEFQRYLHEDLPVPEWFAYPQVMAELKKTYPPRHLQGLTIFFTGLSGAGKSTVANALRIKLLEMGGRPVTLLDGDVVRKNLSSELSFSKEHRDLNIRRIGYVASEITKNGGIAICAPIAPYAAIRREVRETISAVGGFVEIHVATPLSECERRDRKGLYAKARAGLVKGFTGIDDPYEVPVNPEMVLDTTALTPDDCAQHILQKLTQLGFIKNN